MFRGIDVSTFDDPEFKEDSVREPIIAPIIARLGYRPTGATKVVLSKALKEPYLRLGTRKLPVTLVPDYTFLHDGKPIFILDAKAPNKSVIDDEQVLQVYSYALHRDIRCNEFGLCNGRQLAIYHVDHRDPAFVIGFEEFEVRWAEIERHLLPQYLLQPELRRFSPDLGVQFSRLGVLQFAEFDMLGVRLNLFARVSDALFTATANCYFEGAEYCVSFDFEPSKLKEIVAGLPEQLREKFLEALSHQPFMAAAGLVVEIDVSVRLGPEKKVKLQEFRPLLIERIRASRFNPQLVAGDPKDIPPQIFQLRNAFKVRELVKGS